LSQVICPKFEHAAKLLSKRWIGLIVNQLLKDSKRFKVLQDEIQISAKVLSERLKLLEEEGIILRNVYPETPVRIEYTLTEKGKSLAPIMKEIENWAEQWVG